MSGSATPAPSFSATGAQEEASISKFISMVEQEQQQFAGASVKQQETPVDTMDMSYTAAGAPLRPPAADAEADEKMDFIHEQLDSLGQETPVLNGLVLLGNGENDRIQGGMHA